MKLLSDQVSEKEIAVIMRQAQRMLDEAIEGDFVEFGCYVGTTSVFLAELLASSDRKLWLFDSFMGLPEKTAEDSSPAGEQFQPGKLLAPKKVLEKNLARFDRRSIRIKKAWFSDLGAQDVPDSIAFAFLDGDYYHSILDPLQLIWPRLADGAVVIVDDYANEALPGAARAVDEWVKTHNLQVQTEQSLAIFTKSA